MTLLFDCPVCGRSEGLQVQRGLTGKWIFLCRSCGGGLTYLRDVADAVGATVVQLIDDPAGVLGQPATVQPQRTRASSRLPTEKKLGWWAKRLIRNGTRRAHLGARGITTTAMRDYELGWDGEAYTLPVFDEEGAIVNLIRNRPGHRVKYKAMRGRPAALYPDLPSGDRFVLVAGMYDALLGRAYGVPTVTTTCGSSFPAALAPRFAGKLVAVVFDAGEEEQAVAAAHKLIAAGADANVVPLPLPPGGDLTDWFVTYGYSLHDLNSLLTAVWS